MNIEEEFEKFIEFPGDSKNYVTTVSAKLFAKHCVEKEREMKQQTRDWLKELAEIKNNTKAIEILEHIKKLESQNEQLNDLYLKATSYGNLE